LTYNDLKLDGQSRKKRSSPGIGHHLGIYVREGGELNPLSIPYVSMRTPRSIILLSRRTTWNFL
jgi:hypothetical protein